jgi:radical SAM superfamily enzyme YgiQ (UPF0313 family)
MRILLVNPPDCGRSIPEECYGITSLKQIFRGEPLALETLAGNLHGHQVRIVDLKAAPEEWGEALAGFSPDLVGLTGVTCEANTVVGLAAEVKSACGALTVVGGSHASGDPAFFNRPEIDFVVVGLGARSFRELADALERGDQEPAIPGVAATTPGRPLQWLPRRFTAADLLESQAPRYDLVARYRHHYTLDRLGIRMGLVSSASGCPRCCDFCSIAPLTGGRYLVRSREAVLRDIALLGEIPVVRLVDANTFGDPRHARCLAADLCRSGLRKQFVADVRADTVVRHPELLRLWKEAGLRAVIMGLEEISDAALTAMNKGTSTAVNQEAVRILHEIGLTIVGDFIISPDYDEGAFDALERYLEDNRVDLPMFSVLTPLPGTPLHRRMRDRILIQDLDYYTLTNSVVGTRLREERFYRRYARLLQAGHAAARL